MVYYVIISLLVGFVVSSAKLIFLEDGSGEMTCEENNEIYREGERMPHNTPCDKPCWCSASGKKRCREMICEYPACYDAVKVRKECCPRCPNGANCKMTGFVLKQGESMTQLLGSSCSSVCTCIYGGQEPTCILECDDVPPLELLDTSHTSPNPMPWIIHKKGYRKDRKKLTKRDKHRDKMDRRARKDRRRRHRRPFSIV